MDVLPDPTCPLCSGTQRVVITLMDGSGGLYCQHCKFVEKLADSFIELPHGFSR